LVPCITTGCAICAAPAFNVTTPTQVHSAVLRKRRLSIAEAVKLTAILTSSGTANFGTNIFQTIALGAKRTPAPNNAARMPCVVETGNLNIVASATHAVTPSSTARVNGSVGGLLTIPLENSASILVAKNPEQSAPNSVVKFAHKSA